MTLLLRRVCHLAATAALLGAGPPAVAQPADEAQSMRDFFAGTLEIDVPASNWSAKRYYAPDHTYRETGADGEVRGAWSIENGKICTTAGKALGDDRAAKYCNLGLGKHIGETWQDRDPVTDNAVLFRLTSGRA
jgi:hypothetical protein